MTVRKSWFRPVRSIFLSDENLSTYFFIFLIYVFILFIYFFCTDTTLHQPQEIMYFKFQGGKHYWFFVEFPPRSVCSNWYDLSKMGDVFLQGRFSWYCCFRLVESLPFPVCWLVHDLNLNLSHCFILTNIRNERKEIKKKINP